MQGEKAGFLGAAPALAQCVGGARARGDSERPRAQSQERGGVGAETEDRQARSAWGRFLFVRV